MPHNETKCYRFNQTSPVGRNPNFHHKRIHLKQQFFVAWIVQSISRLGESYATYSTLFAVDRQVGKFSCDKFSKFDCSQLLSYEENWCQKLWNSILLQYQTILPNSIKIESAQRPLGYKFTHNINIAFLSSGPTFKTFLSSRLPNISRRPIEDENKFSNFRNSLIAIGGSSRISWTFPKIRNAFENARKSVIKRARTVSRLFESVTKLREGEKTYQRKLFHEEISEFTISASAQFYKVENKNR